MQSSFIARDHLDRLLEYWWVVFICMIVGAGLGWIFHHFQPPLYESRSSISTMINYAETGFMTDLEEDHALTAVGDVILSDTVIAKLQDSLPQDLKTGLSGDIRDYLFGEREGYRWVLRVRAGSPVIASSVSSQWAQIAMRVLEESQNHAQQALLLSRQMNDLEDCLAQSFSSAPASLPCSLPGDKAVKEQLEDLGKEYRQEAGLSNGILPSLVFTLTSSGDGSKIPVTFRSAELVLAGAFLGFFAGVILILIGFPKRKSRA